MLTVLRRLPQVSNFIIKYGQSNAAASAIRPIAAAILKYAFRRTFTIHQIKESKIEDRSEFMVPVFE